MPFVPNSGNGDGSADDLVELISVNLKLSQALLLYYSLLLVYNKLVSLQWRDDTLVE